MPRQKKDGEKISLYLKKDLIDALRKNAEDKGQTLTAAMEFAIKDYLQNETSLKTHEVKQS